MLNVAFTTEIPTPDDSSLREKGLIGFKIIYAYAYTVVPGTRILFTIGDEITEDMFWDQIPDGYNMFLGSQVIEKTNLHVGYKFGSVSGVIPELPYDSEEEDNPMTGAIAPSTCGKECGGGAAASVECSDRCPLCYFGTTCMSQEEIDTLIKSYSVVVRKLKTNRIHGNKKT